MDELFGRIRSGAGKAAFEADKLRRVNAVQGKVKSLKQQVEKAYYQVGQVAFSLYGDGRITQPALKEVCDWLSGLQAQIAAHEQEIVAIRAEEFVEPQILASPQYGRLCPNGHGPIPLPNNFCQTCGAKAIEIPPPAPLYRPPAAAAFCLNCGASLDPNARFCSNCGHTTPVPTPTSPPVTQPGSCPNCGIPLMPDAVFCSECGHHLTPGAPAAQISTAPAPEVEEMAWPGIAAVPTETGVSESGIPDEITSDADFELPISEEAAPSGDWTDVSPMPKAGVCPNCGAALFAEALFCAECGHHIAHEEEE